MGNTADLKTPRKCLMSKPRLAAFSYMIAEPSCQGIPSQLRPQYERELNQCVKETIILTPLERLVEKLSPISQLPRPLISQHIVEKRDNQVCISVQRSRLVPRSAKANLKSPGLKALGAKWSNSSVLILLPAKPNNLNNVPRLVNP